PGELAVMALTFQECSGRRRGPGSEGVNPVSFRCFRGDGIDEAFAVLAQDKADHVGHSAFLVVSQAAHHHIATVLQPRRLPSPRSPARAGARPSYRPLRAAGGGPAGGGRFARPGIAQVNKAGAALLENLEALDLLDPGDLAGSQVEEVQAAPG